MLEIKTNTIEFTAEKKKDKFVYQLAKPVQETTSESPSVFDTCLVFEFPSVRLMIGLDTITAIFRQNYESVSSPLNVDDFKSVKEFLNAP